MENKAHTIGGKQYFENPDDTRNRKKTYGDCTAKSVIARAKCIEDISTLLSDVKQLKTDWK